jgi:hypothetical protein
MALNTVISFSIELMIICLAILMNNFHISTPVLQGSTPVLQGFEFCCSV